MHEKLHEKLEVIASWITAQLPGISNLPLPQNIQEAEISQLIIILDSDVLAGSFPLRFSAIPLSYTLTYPSAKTGYSNCVFQSPGLDMPIYQLTRELNCIPFYWDKSSKSLVFPHLQMYLWIVRCCFANCTPQISSDTIIDLS